MSQPRPRASLLPAALFGLVLCLGLARPAPGQAQAAGAAPDEPPPPPAAGPPAEVAQVQALPEEGTAPEPLRADFVEWLAGVDPLILARERQVFLQLRTDYQREEFIRRFWQVRDPYLRTARNELRERWEARVAEARARYETLQDDRARIYLVHGEPAASVQVKCTTTRIPAEIWVYRGSNLLSFDFLLIFIRPNGTGPALLWTPNTLGLQSEIEQARGCINGGQLSQALSLARQAGVNYELVLQKVTAKPRPRSEEWLDTFVSLSTDLPAGAPTFDAQLSVAFLGRYQSRTVAQGVLEVPVQGVAVGELEGFRSYNFLLTGEVVHDGSLLESFRYKFGFPAGVVAGEAAIPLAFQRYLRPGDYQLVLRLEDLNGGSFCRREMDLAVPEMDRPVAVVPEVDPESSQLFAEATAAVAAGETSIKIVPPQRELLTGFERFDTLAVGDDIAKVTFFLDDREVLTKNRPPYNVEIDLGDYPRLHQLRVEAVDAEGHHVAGDELLINSGANRFGIKLIEPRQGQSYQHSLLARAEVEVPEDRTLERVEIYLNEVLVATLYQPPYSQPVALPPGEALAYVRAVAYLPDGNSTEDLVFVNAPEYLEEIKVQFVELYTTVLDKAGRPVAGLSRDAFRIFEDGVEQRLSRFETVADLPIHVGVLLDNSGSMRNALAQTRLAALSFFRQILTPKDRAAVITFNRQPTLAVKLTNDLNALGGGLAGLTAEGETSLYDSILFGLYYFTGIKGQRAVLLLSDGKDESSRFTFNDTLEYARRAGVTIYAVGLDLRDPDARRKLTQLAEETGGSSYFIREVSQLEGIYRQIEQELRSQYLLAYQSANTAETESFRAIELKLADPDLTAKTLSGYYP